MNGIMIFIHIYDNDNERWWWGGSYWHDDDDDDDYGDDLYVIGAVCLSVCECFSCL